MGKVELVVQIFGPEVDIFEFEQNMNSKGKLEGRMNTYMGDQ